MSRIQETFVRLHNQGRKALIPFITAGDPEPGVTVGLMQALVRAGADVIELGVPFSDPMADGPTIQRASERALRHGVSLRRVLAMVSEFRRADASTPVVLMGYANPVEAMGRDAFVREAAAAGVDGALIVDYPPEECSEFAAALKAHGLDPIFLLAPTSLAQRYEEVARTGSGYVYYVSLKGVTGAGHLDLDEVAARLPAIRAAVRMPVGVGFGIRDAESAARIAAVADAVVIGSRLIEEIEQSPRGEEAERVSRLLRTIREGMDRAMSAEVAR